jgi:two-component system catabolic regulation response regulator CreB
MAESVLLIEDEASIADTLVYALRSEGFDVVWHALGRDGMAHLKANRVSLIILDVGLPDANGFELCKQIRTRSDVPIIFLTARKEEVDRIVGLEIGGDDYVTKPFSPREVAARVKVVLRRIHGVDGAGPHLERVAGFELNDERKQIRFLGKVLGLTRYEYLILKTMLGRPGRVFSREQLIDQVWDEPEASFDRAVDTHIKGLRAKLREIQPGANPIRTHRGLGYSLDADAEPQ